MASPAPPSSPADEDQRRADRLEAALVEILRFDPGANPGGEPDFLALAGHDPTLVAELQAFWAAHQSLLRTATPVRAALSGNKLSENGQIDPLATRHLSPGEQTPLVTGGRQMLGAPASLGEYDLLDELGRGGMGVVFKARHRRLGRVVALKMISGGRFADPEEILRFRAEARAAAALTHPGIVPLFEAGEAEGTPYLAMALIEGVSLAEHIRQAPLAADEAAHLLRKIAAAVAYAHQHGVVHRDLKPGNILLERSSGDGSSSAGRASAGGGGWEPRITDFGLAKQLTSDDTQTATGRVLGTPSYMPPEQAAGKQNDVREAADIYSLGALLYAMLTGRAPFIGESPVEVLLQVLESEPAPPSALLAGIPRELEWICLKCLEKKPTSRYDTAGALAADLQRFLLREPPLARPPDLIRRLRTWIRREPVLAWHVLALSGVLLLIQAIFLTHAEAEWLYHLRVSGVLAIWLIGAVVFHALRRSFRDSAFGCGVWILLDLGCLTALFAQLAGPLGPLLAGYPLLIVASGLFFRPVYVAAATFAASAANLLLFALRPEEAPEWHYLLLFQAILLVVGLCTGYQVWRMQVLSEFYNEKIGNQPQ